MKYLITYIFVFMSMLGTASAREVLIDKSVAVINDEIKTLSDLKEYRTLMRAKKARFTKKEFDELMSSDKALLDKLINDVLMAQYIKDKGMEPSEQDVQNSIDRILKQFGMTKNEFVKRLKVDGMTLKQFKAEKKQDLVFGRFFEIELKRMIAISENDLALLYKKKTGEDTRVSEYQIQHILLSTDKDALEVKKLALEGDNFKDLAYKYSTDEGTKLQGGDLGFLPLAYLNKPLRDAVKQMSVNEVKGPIETKLGLHVIKLKNIRFVENENYISMKEKLKLELIEEESKKQVKLWGIKRREESYVKVTL